MKKFYNLLILLAVPSTLILFAYSGGSPGGKTGSMGDNGNTCTDCHSGTAMAEEGWISTDIPAVGFMPGDTYIITARGSHEAVVKFGFELTAEDETGEKTGSFTIVESDRTKLANAGTSVTHTSGGTTPNGDFGTWTMEWTAPDPAPEVVKFYAAFNAANGNGGTTGDVIYTSETSVSQQHVGLENEILAESISVYPNPAVNELNIESPEGASISVFDISGRLVVSIDHSQKETKLELSTWDSGLYFVRFDYNGGVATQKLIVN